MRPSLLIGVLVSVSPSFAQESYRLPPPEVVAILDAAPAPSVRMSPDRAWMLMVESPAMPSIADVSRPMLRLAGMRIDPVANAPYRTGYDSGLLLRATRDVEAEPERVPLAQGASLASVSWAPDSQRFAFSVATDHGTDLYVASVTAPQRPRLVVQSLNGVLGGFEWLDGGQRILGAVVPKDRGPEPAEPRVPTGPNVRESSGETSPLRTYQDLLSNPHEEALFDHYATAQLALFDLGPGPDGELRRTNIGAPALLSGFELAPDGAHLLVTTIQHPYSYLQPFYAFPSTTAVWDLAGKQLHVVEHTPLSANIPIGGVREGRRSVQWWPHRDATLLWVEAQDGGDPKREVALRDTWFAHAAPFDGEPSALVSTEHRARRLEFTQDPGHLITSEYDRDRRWTRSLLHDLDDPASPPRVLDDRAQSDRYGDPGRFVREVGPDGRSLVRLDGGWAYRTGSGASPEGLLPFLDRIDLATLETERLWRCLPGEYESAVAIGEPSADFDTAPDFYTSHETPTSPPNYRLRTGIPAGSTSGERRETGGDVFPLTRFADPTPQLRGIHKELVTYDRADGVELSATLYLPAGYEEGQRLPLLVWAYPLEYNDPATAGQISASPSRFTRISGLSHLVLLTQGYAILDGATMPIVGDAETMNDAFIEQIVASAAAAIDYAVERGVADRSKCVVGGHSYGAFMTANLLAHSDLFATGVARSGAYNRSLTPFGFQSERRTFWEAPEAYFAVSPFMHADKINEPLLMIHGEIDNNSGTFPIQSDRLFQAIKGNGGTARLVTLPAESHGYRARESVLHVQAETIEWLERFVTPERPH